MNILQLAGDWCRACGRTSYSEIESPKLPNEEGEVCRRSLWILVDSEAVHYVHNGSVVEESYEERNDTRGFKVGKHVALLGRQNTIMRIFRGVFDDGPTFSATDQHHLMALSHCPLHLDESPTVEDDLFAPGVNIWELFTGKRPFDGLKGIDAEGRNS